MALDQSINLSIFLSVCQLVCPVYLFCICLTISLPLSIYLSIYLPPSLSLSLALSRSLFLSLSLSLSVSLSLSLSLSTRLCVYLPTYPQNNAFTGIVSCYASNQLYILICSCRQYHCHATLLWLLGGSWDVGTTYNWDYNHTYDWGNPISPVMWMISRVISPVIGLQKNEPSYKQLLSPLTLQVLQQVSPLRTSQTQSTCEDSLPDGPVLISTRS